MKALKVKTGGDSMKLLLKHLNEDILDAVRVALKNSSEYIAADVYKDALIDIIADAGKVFIRLSDSSEFEVEARIELREVARDIKADLDIDPEEVDAIATEMIKIGRDLKRHAAKIANTP